MRNSTTYKQAASRFFRRTSSQILPKKRQVLVGGYLKTVRKGWGSNLQNIEKSMREIYIPDEGMCFGQTDQAGAEALVVAHLTRDGAYRSLFKNKIKPHTYICTHIFKDVWAGKMREHGLLTNNDAFNIDEILACPIPQLKNHQYWKPLDSCIRDSDNWQLTERYYYLGKQTEHSSNYDIQPPTFRMNILEKSGGKIMISVEDSVRFIKTKHSLFPEIKEDFHNYVRKMAKTTGYLYDLHGFPHAITADISGYRDSDWKELYALIPQATVAEITKKAYIAFQNFTEENNLRWDLLADTHDSYMWQCPIAESVECAKKSKEFMEQTLVSPFDGTSFKMGSETSIGFNWRPYHKDKNPNGLKEIKL